MGFELFDKPNWVGSEFDEQVNYQRALEGELEHTVGSLADVEVGTRAPGDRTRFAISRSGQACQSLRGAEAASRRAGRRRSGCNSQPCRVGSRWTSAADHVVLVDASGHLPLGPRTAEGLQLNAEQALEEKLISTLEPVTGSGNVRASVTLDYDPDAIEETKESYDPAQSAMLSMERSEQSDRPAADSSRSSRNRIECPQHPDASRVSEADHAASDLQD